MRSPIRSRLGPVWSTAPATKRSPSSLWSYSRCRASSRVGAAVALISMARMSPAAISAIRSERSEVASEPRRRPQNDGPPSSHYVRYNVVMPPKTQPFSIRLGEQANLLVEDEVRRSGRSRSVVVEELAEEAAKARLHPGVAFRGRPRRAWVIGSGLDVWEIVELLGSYGDDLKALTSDHPLVTERHLRTARAYAAQFAGEIDALLEENRRPPSELVDLYPFLQHPGR